MATRHPITSVILFHDPQYIDMLRAELVAFSGSEVPTVVALGADAEFMLDKHSVPYLSGRNLRRTAHVDQLAFVEKLVYSSLDNKLFDFLEYRRIHIGKIYAVALQTYLFNLAYFVDMIASLAEDFPELKEIRILHTDVEIPETSRLFSFFETYVVEIAARLVCDQRGIAFFRMDETNRTKISSIQRAKNWILWKKFWLQRSLFGIGLSLFNLFISAFAPRKKIRVLVTDIWRNIGPFVEKIPEGEIVLMDRMEVFQMEFRTIWRHRARFMHIDQYVSRRDRRRASVFSRQCADEWERIRQERTSPFTAETFRGYSFAEPMETAFSTLMSRGVRRAVELIEGAHHMLEVLKPDVVLVRASASGQPHFGVLCEVTRSLGIPSLEVQHGIFYFGRGSYSNRRSVEYIAGYGPILRESFRSIGYVDNQVFDVGSPRFDKYASLRHSEAMRSKKEDSFTVTCILPGIARAFWTDHYEAFDFLSDIADAMRDIPHAQVLLSMRSGADHEGFFREAIRRAFDGVSHCIIQDEPLEALFAKSDVIVSCHSTTMLEALLSGVATVYDAIMPMHAVLGNDLGSDFDAYAKEGALAIVYTPGELKKILADLAVSPEKRAALAQGASRFMEHNYAFDGNSSARLADVVRSLAAR